MKIQELYMTNINVKTQNNQASKERIEIIKDRVDLVEIIEKHIDLKIEGAQHVGLCPFHDEKTPSFHVERYHYHCFGCGAHGDVFDFLQNHLNLPFNESLDRLSSDYGISTINSMGADEKKALHESFKKRKEEDEKRRVKEREDAAKESNRIWASSSTELHNDPNIRKKQLRYIDRKGIFPTAVRFGKNQMGFYSIIIPLRNIKGEIRTLQFISVDGGGKIFKSFLPAGEKKGNFFQIGKIIDGEPFSVAEGYATSVSVHKGSNRPVIAAMDSGNLSSVIGNLYQKYPNSEITMAGDNDKVGIEKANEVAKMFGCKVVFPKFPEDKELNDKGEMLTDFNDLQQACGIEEVKKQLEQTIEHKVFKPHSLEDLLLFPDKEWLIDQVIGAGDLGMFYGPAGTGKTFLVIDMIISCLMGYGWAERFKTKRPLNIAYCAGEGLSGLKSRFGAAVKHNKVKPSLKNFTFFNTMPQLFLEHEEADHETIKRFVDEWKSNQEKGTADPLDILFIDTLHTSTIGADENSAKDMGKALHLCRYASKELGCAVVLIHHSNKGGNEERGSSALRGAMDVIIEITKPKKDPSTMICSKLKDGKQWQSQNFELIPVDGTKSVCVSWKDLIDSKEKKGKADEHIERILRKMNEYPESEFTVKQVSEIIGEKESNTRKLLKKMTDTGVCCKKLKNPKQEKLSKNNPYVYWKGEI